MNKSLQSNEMVRKNFAGNNEALAYQAWIELQTQLNCFMDSSKDPSSNMNPPLGIQRDFSEALFPIRADCWNNINHNGDSVLFSNLSPIQAVARCVSQRWPSLLVGASATGKSSIVSTLAHFCNATLVEQCLSPSSDVTEIL